MAERGITLEAMKDVVKYPQTKQKQVPGIRGGTVFRFSKMRGPTKLTVVAEIKGQDCWLMTTF